MGISYKDTEDFCSINRSTFKSLISQIEEIMIDGRDNRNIPIYLTNYRVKSLDSLYLKTKRHQETELSNITDCAGYRILCLFEEEIYDIHKFAIETLKYHFSLVEFISYNYTNVLFLNSLEQIIINNFPDIIPQRKTKDSGYKSIHYIFKQHREGKDYFVEIQLRTLLQDVWSELEHKLAYKQGNIHPHIKKSFELLAKDLGNKDSLISHLKSIRDQEQVGQLYVLEKGGPIDFYGYEPYLIPKLFLSDPHKSHFEAYRNHMQGIANLQKNKDESIDEADRLFKNIINNITMSMERDVNLEYFIDMESAFLYFWRGGKINLDRALEIYKRMEKRPEFSRYYILYFRMGEIFFIKGEIVNALKSFDRCEEILNSQEREIDYINHFRVKLKIAYLYWLLGQEYADYSLNAIYDANKIYEGHMELFHDREKTEELLLNNFCSYQLEKFLKTKSYDDCGALMIRLQDFESFMNERTLNANAADTLAWTYYQIFLEDNDHEKLERAKKYCENIDESINYSTHKMASIALHKNHIQEIMSAK